METANRDTNENGAMANPKIVVGVDGSEHSARALQWCADHAEGFGAEVLVVHVI